MQDAPSRDDLTEIPEPSEAQEATRKVESRKDVAAKKAKSVGFKPAEEDADSIAAEADLTDRAAETTDKGKRKVAVKKPVKIGVSSLFHLKLDQDVFCIEFLWISFTN